jgi:hypothetical protein
MKEIEMKRKKNSMKVIAKQKAFAYQDVDWVSHLEVNANHFGRHKKHFELLFL